MEDLQFVLASASPARRKLLTDAGISVYTCPSNFDEDQVQINEPGELVCTLAQSKAQLVAPQFKRALVLGCDSVLAFNGQIYGKPDSPADAIARWQAMRGNVGELYTGHALIDTVQQTAIVRCRVTQVYFAVVSNRQIADYVATGEPLGCAGAFAIDGKGSCFIEKLDGCHTNVIGLSMPLLRELIHELGYDITDFWSAS
ncbi:Maf family protein [Leptolyngbya iicbica]|uniref:Nucleoside triphosphate pyrophosphatase n=2 Tax=Cyanophyceae TaxID=3028117 RepID=A0A4Q7EAJ6_9CYAN|nr:nucleoside triphosphate pyrophosphatase [Leptolyngbya sp. LK]RZM79638.1 septum formation inhibitor Maf [Leptolyngbya sp. LK]